MRVLFDLDGVLADLVTPLSKKFDFRKEDVTAFNFNDCLGKIKASKIYQEMARPGFCAELQPMEGALSVLKEVQEQGHEIVFVTAPFPYSRTWSFDRMLWLKREFREIDAPVILTDRKDLVSGDLLVEDRVKNLAAFKETGRKGLLIDQPWNQTDLLSNERCSLAQVPTLVQNRAEGGNAGYCPDCGELVHECTELVDCGPDLDKICGEWGCAMHHDHYRNNKCPAQ